MKVLPETYLGTRVKTLIKQVGSAEKLARLTGMSARVIGQYAAGTSEPTVGKLISLATAAGVDVGWLATGEGEMRRTEVNGHTANGNNIIQGAHIDAEDIHLIVHQVKEDPAPTYADPIDGIFLKDWKSLSDIGKMRIWTLLKEEIQREKERKEG